MKKIRLGASCSFHFVGFAFLAKFVLISGNANITDQIAVPSSLISSANSSDNTNAKISD